jgi:D-alanyl-lipoteichoic acid acyltransferase DltB (MBOAT superfamily)
LVITFNFVNIAWIFFRAKEWEDAIKVLKGMVGLSGVVISEKLLYKIKFFQLFISENPELFGKLIFGSTTFTFILYGLVLALFFKNTVEWSKKIKFDYKTLVFLIVIAIGTLFNMSKVTEFLYFNF